MKKYRILAAGVCFFVFALAARGAFSSDNDAVTTPVATPAAVVVKVQGEASLSRGGEQSEVEDGLPLIPGDKLTIGADSSVLALFSNGKKLKATADYEISEADAAISGAEPSVVEKAAAMLVGSTSSAVLEAASGTLTTEDAPALTVSFLDTKTTETRPVFRWETMPAAKSSKIVLMNSGGDELWIAETNGNEVPYPDDLVPLPGGAEYRFTVTSKIGGRDETAEAKFFLLSQEESARVGAAAEAIKKEFPGDDAEICGLLLAALYNNEGLYAAAESELKRIIALDETAAFPRRDLAALYLRTGNIAYAARELAKTAGPAAP